MWYDNVFSNIEKEHGNVCAKLKCCKVVYSITLKVHYLWRVETVSRPVLYCASSFLCDLYRPCYSVLQYTHIQYRQVVCMGILYGKLEYLVNQDDHFPWSALFPPAVQMFFGNIDSNSGFTTSCREAYDDVFSLQGGPGHVHLIISKNNDSFWGAFSSRGNTACKSRGARFRSKLLSTSAPWKSFFISPTPTLIEVDLTSDI